MKNKMIIFAMVCCSFSLNVSAQIASGGAFSLEKAALANGGGASSSGTFSVTGTIGQSAAGTPSSNSVFGQFGGFWTPDQLSPTAAMVSISGNVRTVQGNGIRNAVIKLTDASGAVRTTVSSSFGAFRFTDVEVGQTYVLTVNSKRFTFINSTQILSVNDELTNLEFTADE